MLYVSRTVIHFYDQKYPLLEQEVRNLSTAVIKVVLHSFSHERSKNYAT